jgi:hypothetical protein
MVGMSIPKTKFSSSLAASSYVLAMSAVVRVRCASVPRCPSNHFWPVPVRMRTWFSGSFPTSS